MTRFLQLMRILMVVAFFINITALFLTHFSMAVFPCTPIEVLASNDWWCIEESNPIAKNVMVLGGFWGHFSFQILVWGLAFMWWERRILRKEPWNRFSWIPAFGVLFFLSIDLLHDINVFMNTLVVAGL